jgi:transposase
LPAAVGFEVLPKRWIVERTFAWLSRFRRLARDFERYARTVAAFIRLAIDPHQAEAARCKPLVMNPNFADGALTPRSALLLSQLHRLSKK